MPKDPNIEYMQKTWANISIYELAKLTQQID